METIYLDNNATTRAADEVIAAMQPFGQECFANPSSPHVMGQAARHAVEEARRQVAALIGAKPRQIVFTGGGTESDNLAILGTLDAYPTKKHVVTTAVEHVAVHSLCEQLAKRGYRVTFVGVDSNGCLDPRSFADALQEDTALASVMHANNETGVIFPIREIAHIASSRGIPLHVDAVQAAGKLDVDVEKIGADLLTISAHKMHGPKGVGALYVGRGVRLRSRVVGGHQERDIRPGTENVPGIVGFGAAAALAQVRLGIGFDRIAALRDRLEEGLLDRIHFAAAIGHQKQRICNTTIVAFEALEAEAILIGLSERGLCAASGSACSSGSLEASHVLHAMGIDRRIAHGAVRFSLSWDTTDRDIDRALEIVPQIVERLAALAPTR